MVWDDHTEMPWKPLSRVIDEDGSYNFRHYAYTSQGILAVNFFSKLGETVSLQLGSSSDEAPNIVGNG